MIENIAQRWRILSGGNKWDKLLNPLDSDLQKYILHYGSMAQSTYDAFNSERLSKYSGTSRYSRKNLFSSVGLDKGNPFKYKAVKYIYATSNICVPDCFLLKPRCDQAWCKTSNWIGYVAVATDEGKAALGRRDILVAWRGTIQPVEFAKDFDFPLVSASTILGTNGEHAKVHKGFLSMYTSNDPTSNFSLTSARNQVLSELKKQIEEYKNEEVSITITGHSLGAALSTLTAADIICNGYNKTCPVTAFLFASPRVGDSNFNSILESTSDLHILSIQNAPDIVPHLPPGDYSEVGVKLIVDNRKSPYLKDYKGTLSYHNLEAAYLHPLAIDNGSENIRDIGLVNKTTSALKEEYFIPNRWWCEKNKGMVQVDDGKWKLRDHEKDDDDDEKT